MKSELRKQQYTVTLFDCNHLAHVIVSWQIQKLKYVTVPRLFRNFTVYPVDSVIQHFNNWGQATICFGPLREAVSAASITLLLYILTETAHAYTSWSCTSN